MQAIQMVQCQRHKEYMGHAHSQPAGFLLLKFLWVNKGFVDGLDHQFAAVDAFRCNDVVNV